MLRRMPPGRMYKSICYMADYVALSAIGSIRFNPPSMMTQLLLYYSGSIYQRGLETARLNRRNDFSFSFLFL